jgi:HEXXH motif-containing protein
MSSQLVESSNQIPGHRVPRSLIEQVFAGPVDSSAMAALLDGQYSRRLLLLKVLRDSVVSGPPSRMRRVVEDAWPILVSAEKRAPKVVREILLYPSVGTWLVRVIRKIRGIIDDDVPIWVDMGYLGSIAASAAIRTGIDVTATAMVWRCRISLPTVGQFEAGGDDSPRHARLRTRGSTAFLESPDGEWISLRDVPAFPLRLHRSTAGGRSLCWMVDDIDPYRSFAGMAANDRLGSVEFDSWCDKLDRAWEILVEEHEDYLPELSAASPVIVPADRAAGFVASSSAASFGAIRAAMPQTPADMAETLLHELQHSKLNALLDLVPLQRPGTDRPCYAPWRRDPRPLSGLLHGIYAFIGVTEYWYRRWRSQPELTDRTAAFHFLHHQEQVRDALRALGPTPELTDAGDRFLTVATARLNACDNTAVPADVRAAVTGLTGATRLFWRMRYLAPPKGHVALLADRRLAGERATAEHVESPLRRRARPEAASALPALFTAEVLTPNDPVAEKTVRPGESELVRRDLAAARSLFADRIRTDPDDDGAWVGLLMAMEGGGPLPPETVSATFRRMVAVSDVPPDPVTLVEWFANG